METHLKLRDHDEEREIQFELRFFRTLTVQQRFAWMLRQSRWMAEMLVRRGHRKPTEMLKRA